VITGDFNAHHQVWGSSSTNYRGKEVWTWVENTGLVLLNDGSPTRLNKAQGTLSCIDLTLASPKISASLAWGVVNDTMGSDHFPLIISLNAKINEDQNLPKQKKLNYEKADWSTFHTLCQDITYEEVYSNDINIFLENLTEKIMDKAGPAIPTFTPRAGGHKSVPWWNENCQKAVQERKKSYK
jgi:hypothetical protein